jgi:hypothetical protein
VDRYEVPQGAVQTIGFASETTTGGTLQITQPPTWEMTSRDGLRAASGTCTVYDTDPKQKVTASVCLNTAAVPAGPYFLTATMHVVGSDGISRVEKPSCLVVIVDRPPWP